MIDRLRYRSDRLPTDHFDARFSDDNLRFWVPVLIEAARVEKGMRVLDVGCGTGGISRAVAAATGAAVTGYDISERFIAEARRRGGPSAGRVEWVVGDAARLPFADGSFDRVLLSMVLHQVPDAQAAVREAFRVLSADDLVLVRTIAPEDAHDRVPERYLPRMAEVDAARLHGLDALEEMLTGAGFAVISEERVFRNKVLTLAEQEQELLVEARSRYEFLTEDELENAVRRMRADAEASGGRWIDPRPTVVLVASRP